MWPSGPGADTRPTPYRESDGRNNESWADERVVRGGSFLDPPHLWGPTVRTAYPAGRRLFNVGVRVVGGERNARASR